MPGLHVLPGLERELDEQGRAGDVAGHRLGERVGVPLGRRPRPRGIAQPPRALGQLDGGSALEPEDRQVRGEAEQRRRERGIELADMLCLLQQHRVSRLHLPARHPQAAEQDDELGVEARIVDQVRRLVGERLAPHEISGCVHGVCRTQQPSASRGASLRQRGGPLEGGRACAEGTSRESPRTGAVELVRDHVVEPYRGRGQMPRAAIGIGVRGRERGVHAPPLSRIGAVVGGGPNEWMTELEPVRLDVQQSERFDFAEIPLGDPQRAERAEHDTGGAGAVRRGDHGRQTAIGGERREARGESPLEAVRRRDRVRQRLGPGELAGRQQVRQLDERKRVPVRGIEDPHQHLRRNPSFVLGQHPRRIFTVEWTDGHDVQTGQRAVRRPVGRRRRWRGSP